MKNSIQQFCEKGIKKLNKVFDGYADDLTKVSEMVHGVTDCVAELGLSLIAEEWESYDQVLRDRKDLRPGWYIVRRDTVSKLTSLGVVTYRKTYFKNKETGTGCYLLDRLMDFSPRERLTEDAMARILDEAADSSYRKGGMNASISGDIVSKETVMDELHGLDFPEVAAPDEKRKVQTLYIDANEDHVALQYFEKKGDLKGTRGKTVMPKLAYVYEGINTDEGRHSLINPVYFGGINDGSDGNRRLWEKIYDYISRAYDEDSLERIYINGDGADWIKAGAKMHGKAKFVLDKYHMHKYIIAATSHLMDSAEDARSELWRAINGKRKWLAEVTFDKILAVTESETKREAVKASETYILGQWPAIMNGVRNRKDNIHCSAEGHVSHIFSDRMSSRPLGWCVVGADKMAQLRIYKRNGGDMLELVRYQKQVLPKAAGSEEVIYSAGDIIQMERKNRAKLGDLADIKIYTIPYTQVHKIAALKNHIWGL